MFKRKSKHILCSTIFFPKIMLFMRQFGKIWYNQTGQRYNIVRRMGIARGKIRTRIDTQSEYLIFLAVLRQQLLRERE
jgi:hypothetical protein